MRTNLDRVRKEFVSFDIRGKRSYKDFQFSKEYYKVTKQIRSFHFHPCFIFQDFHAIMRLGCTIWQAEEVCIVIFDLSPLSCD